MAAFNMINLNCPEYRMMRDEHHGGLRHLETFLDNRIHKLQLLFEAGKASPYDVDLEGNTILHVRAELSSTSSH